tara:strand:- start:5966 stop:6862 length:897 start_codon:yes stop_codon:yes gene_type:complete
MRVVVTGGAGFIGSSFVNLLGEKGYEVLVVDNLTYAGDLENICSVNYRVLVKDICDVTADDLGKYDYLINFAAESHVDNSIEDGRPFVRTNIEGTFNLLELARKNKDLKKFIQISTDEVYGDLKDLKMRYAQEHSPLRPSSYYSSTKASADMLVQACGRTYNLPYLITRTCNNFGSNQHKEKFIPVIIDNVINQKPIPVYGDGQQSREWIWVEDNVKHIYNLMISDYTGTQNIGSKYSYKNLEIINMVSKIVGKKVNYKFVADRLGHDKLYRVKSQYDQPKITKTLQEFLKEEICKYL